MKFSEELGVRAQNSVSEQRGTIQKHVWFPPWMLQLGSCFSVNLSKRNEKSSMEDKENSQASYTSVVIVVLSFSVVYWFAFLHW